MSPGATPWLLMAGAWLGWALLTSALLAVAWRRWERRALGAPPLHRARVAERFALGAVLAPTALLALCLLPGLLALAGGGDHCRRHPEHLHLCLVHAHVALRPAAQPALLAACAVAALRALRFLYARRRELDAARRLAGLRRAGAGPIQRVASRRPFALTTGLLRPRIWLSDALAAALPSEQLAVVLAHERAHARRRDPLRALVLALLSLPLGAATRVRLLRAWSLAVEQACDEAAAREVGDRVRVAETILAVERALGARAAHPAPGTAFAGSDVGERVRGLLAPPAPPPDPARHRVAWSVAAALLALAAADPLHHLAEHVLDALLGG